jgi:hypothetical protein
MIQLSLLFHANQALTPFVAVASRACYRGLWAVLRDHPRVRCSLHISGTLLHTLLWLDPEALDPLRAGLVDGQFELLGSTYAQNVPYATHDADNRRQIAAHRALLQATFGVEPAGFWNAERCWRQSLVPLIVEGGYRYTLVEDHALQRAGAADLHTTYRTREDAHALDVLPDSEPVKAPFNWAIWSGEHAPLLAYLRGVPGGIVTYAEDAEAAGLWGYERGLLPQADWARLDALLTALEHETGLTFVPLGELPPPALELTTIPDSQATWMVASLQHTGLPYHEDGYADWFDFNARAPKNVHYRKLYDDVRAVLPERDAGSGAGDAGEASERLLSQAGHALIAHQYEFGCIGVGGIGDRLWGQAASAFVLAHAAQLASIQNSKFKIQNSDVNRDGFDEILLSNERFCAVLTPLGGRLLYWFDLARGEELVGNENAVPAAPGGPDAAYPAPRPRPTPWLPADAARDLAPFAARARSAPSPGPWGAFVPEAVWRDARRVTLYDRPAGPDDTPPPDPPRLRGGMGGAIQHRALNDSAWLGRRRVLYPGANRAWDVALDGDGATFAVTVPGVLAVAKRVTLVPDGLEVRYTLRNLAERRVLLGWESDHELCPDYLTLMDHGRGALRYWTRSSERRHGRWRPTTRANHSTRGVVNTVSGTVVALQCDPEPLAARGAESLFALSLALRWEWALEAGAQAALALRLGAESSTTET